MRVREGGFAYEISPVRNPSTLLLEYYRVQIFKLQPVEEVLLEARYKSAEEAQREGEKELAKALKDGSRAA